MSNSELPSEARFALLADEAASLWKEIPNEKLFDIVEAAIISAGNFTANIGLVAKIWNDKKTKIPEMDYAAIGNRDLENARNALPDPTGRLPEEREREENARMFSDLIKKFRGAK